MWVFVRPITEQHDFFRTHFSLPRMDNDRAIHADLLLEHRVRVIPIGAMLTDEKPKCVGLVWLDRCRGEIGHTIVLIG